MSQTITCLPSRFLNDWFSPSANYLDTYSAGSAGTCTPLSCSAGYSTCAIPGHGKFFISISIADFLQKCNNLLQIGKKVKIYIPPPRLCGGFFAVIISKKMPRHSWHYTGALSTLHRKTKGRYLQYTGSCPKKKGKSI